MDGGISPNSNGSGGGMARLGHGVRSGKNSFVSCWNFRGLDSGVPYIQQLISRAPGIIVLFEH